MIDHFWLMAYVNESIAFALIVSRNLRTLWLVVCVVPVGSVILRVTRGGSGFWAPQRSTGPAEDPAEHPLDGQERPTAESLAGQKQSMIESWWTLVTLESVFNSVWNSRVQLVSPLQEPLTLEETSSDIIQNINIFEMVATKKASK